MKHRDYRDYLQDIKENIETAEEFLTGITFEEFREDKKTVYAVVRCIEIIGEASKHIPNSVRKKYKDVPWKRMAGMRDKVIHEYFGVDLEVVWKTVKEEIPQIKPLILEMSKIIKNQGETK